LYVNHKRDRAEAADYPEDFSAVHEGKFWRADTISLSLGRRFWKPFLGPRSFDSRESGGGRGRGGSRGDVRGRGGRGRGGKFNKRQMNDELRQLRGDEASFASDAPRDGMVADGVAGQTQGKRELGG